MIACVIDAPHSSIMIVAIAPASVMTLARSLGLGGCAMGNIARPDRRRRPRARRTACRRQRNRRSPHQSIA